MSYTLPTRFFPTNTGKAAFGSLKTGQTAGDYISNKKAKNTYCNINFCRPYNKVSNQSDLILLNKANYLYRKCNSYNFNKTNLSINLITKIDLTGVKVIASQLTGNSPTTIIQLQNSTSGYLDEKPYYLIYKIDPCGELFGKSTCGINNYQDFVVYNPPYVNNVVDPNKYNCY
jgi:hypothetical protein